MRTVMKKDVVVDERNWLLLLQQHSPYCTRKKTFYHYDSRGGGRLHIKSTKLLIREPSASLTLISLFV